MENIILDDISNFNTIAETLSKLKTPISISIHGRLIPFRTDNELATFIEGFMLAWDILDDMCQLPTPYGSKDD